MASDRELANSANPRALEPDDDPFDSYFNGPEWDDEADEWFHEDDGVEVCSFCGEELADCLCDLGNRDEADWPG